MQTLLLAGALVLWAAAAFVVAAVAASYLPRRFGFAAAPLVLAVLVALPFVDEARAKPRFHALCKERAQVRVGAAHEAGRAARAGWQDAVLHVVGPLVASETRVTYLDASDGRPAYDYSTLTAEPGWFVQWLASPEPGAPMLFRGACAPADLKAWR